MKFSQDFKFGASVWAQGTEGAWNKDNKSMTVFEKSAEMNPSRMRNRVGPWDTLDFYTDYEKYIDMAAEMKLESYRTSITWSRLIPDGKNVNQKAVDFYRKYFEYVQSKGIELSVVLYWFDMPVHLEDRGGFSNREILEEFVYYCTKSYELFHDVLDRIYIFNEPIVDLNFKYQLDMSYPYEVDFFKTLQAQYNMVLGHAMSVGAIKDLKIPTDCELGTVINVPKIYPRSQHPSDLEALRLANLFGRDIWLEPLYSGIYPKSMHELHDEIGFELESYPEDVDILYENTVDILGINSYAPQRVKAKEYTLNKDAPLTFGSFYDDYIMPNRVMNEHRGWEIYPKHLYDTLMYIKDKYPHVTSHITENGMGVQKEWEHRAKNSEINDQYRIDYLESHISWVGKAIEDGCSVKSYLMWSFVDLWSPSNQFLNTYGFIEYNLETGEAKFKKSARWYQKLIETKKLDVEPV